MFDRIKAAKANEEGFTLVELLIVIVILGILAAVVVFSVGGVKDKGQTSACAASRSAVAVAAEAAFAQDGSYPASPALLDGTGFLSSASVAKFSANGFYDKATPTWSFSYAVTNDKLVLGPCVVGALATS